MDYKKLLFLLAALVIWVNYENYFQQDQEKLHQKRAQLKQRILREEALLGEDKILTEDPKQDSPYSGLMYSADLGYSKAMGELQNLVNASAEKGCLIERTDWGESAKSDNWYERLRMRVKMKCVPEAFVLFENAMHGSGKLILIENFHAFRNDNKKLVDISIQIVAYRLKAKDE